MLAATETTAGVSGCFLGSMAWRCCVREGIRIDLAGVRTFQQLRWSQMPDALAPADPGTGTPWYDARGMGRVPFEFEEPLGCAAGSFPGITFVHMLCSHPTPPVFDGKEDRNGCRNHDEIRFWSEYLNNASWIVDDRGGTGGLALDASVRDPGGSECGSRRR